VGWTTTKQRPSPLVLALAALSTLALVAGWADRASGDVPSEPPPIPAESPTAEPAKLAPNSLFVEGFGAAVFYSLNYERMVLDQLGVRVGIGFMPIVSSGDANGFESASSTTDLLVFVPVTASYVGIRSGRSALELGGGVTLLYASAYTHGTTGPSLVPMGVAMVGYRNQPVGQHGFMFRVGVEAAALRYEILAYQKPTLGNLGIFPWPYLSLGASF
jgi:hypothetical protein